MFATTFPLLDVFLEVFYFALLFMWIILLFHIFGDIFRSHDLSGPAKAAWVLFLVVLPFLGVLVYLVARGGSMHERSVALQQAQQKAFEDYIRRVANSKE